MPRITAARLFRRSVLVELTNPKTLMFFLAFLPQFVVPGAGSVAIQLAVLGTIVARSALPCDLAVAALVAMTARGLGDTPRLQRLQHAMTGTVLVLLGVWVLLAPWLTAE